MKQIFSAADFIRPPTIYTSSGVVSASPCLFYGFLLGMDGTNDPEIAIYDNATTNSGQELIPSNTYDAGLLGLNGVTISKPILAQNGVYVEITCGGTAEVIPLISPSLSQTESAINAVIGNV